MWWSANDAMIASQRGIGAVSKLARTAEMRPRRRRSAIVSIAAVFVDADHAGIRPGLQHPGGQRARAGAEIDDGGPGPGDPGHGHGSLLDQIPVMRNQGANDLVVLVEVDLEMLGGAHALYFAEASPRQDTPFHMLERLLSMCLTP